MSGQAPLSDAEIKKRQSRRNWAVFGGLAFFVILVYAVTMVKIALGYGE